MMLSRRQPIHDWQLTSEELEIAKGVKGLPQRFENELRTDPAALPVRTQAMRKLRAFMQEERLLREEGSRYEGFESLVAELETAHAVNHDLRNELATVKREVDTLKRRLAARTAEPALASYGEGTGQ